jgi:hypothetical protein
MAHVTDHREVVGDEQVCAVGLPLNLDAGMLVKALESVLKRIKVAEAQRKPSELVNPLIKHKVISVEEKIGEMCELLEEQGEASLFFLLKDSESRSELVARFMGVLELIKKGQIIITSITVIEDVVEYNETGLEMMFKLNENYVPSEYDVSEFDTVTETTEETKEDTKNGRRNKK